MSYKPDIVYLEIGTCDLTKLYIEGEDLGFQMRELIWQLTRLGVKKIIVGEVIPRIGNGIPYAVPYFNYKVDAYNRFMRVEFDEEYQNTVYFWRHKKLWCSRKPVYSDGTHLNRLGNRRLFRSIRAALIKAMWNILHLL